MCREKDEEGKERQSDREGMSDWIWVSRRATVAVRWLNGRFVL